MSRNKSNKWYLANLLYNEYISSLIITILLRTFNAMHLLNYSSNYYEYVIFEIVGKPFVS